MVAKAIEAEIFSFDEVNTFLLIYNFVTFGQIVLQNIQGLLAEELCDLELLLALAPVWSDAVVIIGV